MRGSRAGKTRSAIYRPSFAPRYQRPDSADGIRAKAPWRPSPPMTPWRKTWWRNYKARLYRMRRREMKETKVEILNIEKRVAELQEVVRESNHELSTLAK